MSVEGSSILPFETAEESGEVVQTWAETVGGLDEFPYLVEVLTNLPKAGYDYAAEFEWGSISSWIVSSGCEAVATTGPPTAEARSTGAEEKDPAGGDGPDRSRRTANEAAGGNFRFPCEGAVAARVVLCATWSRIARASPRCCSSTGGSLLPPRNGPRHIPRRASKAEVCSCRGPASPNGAER